MQELIEALNELTQVMKEQNEINMVLISAILDQQQEDAESLVRYMDGTLIRKVA